MLTRPRPPVVEAALTRARDWCAGHVIDGAPALGHAVKVAATLGSYHPDVCADLVAAVLLHDAPDFVGEEVLAPSVVDGCGSAVLLAVRTIHREHDAMAAYLRNDRLSAFGMVSALPGYALRALSADKVVSLTYVLRRARTAPDVKAYWRQRQEFVRLLPYFREFHSIAEPQVAPSLAAELGRLVTVSELVADSAGAGLRAASA